MRAHSIHVQMPEGHPYQATVITGPKVTPEERIEMARFVQIRLLELRQFFHPLSASSPVIVHTLRFGDKWQARVTVHLNITLEHESFELQVRDLIEHELKPQLMGLPELHDTLERPAWPRNGLRVDAADLVMSSLRERYSSDRPVMGGSGKSFSLWPIFHRLADLRPSRGKTQIPLEAEQRLNATDIKFDMSDLDHPKVSYNILDENGNFTERVTQEVKFAAYPWPWMIPELRTALGSNGIIVITANSSEELARNFKVSRALLGAKGVGVTKIRLTDTERSMVDTSGTQPDD